MFFIFLIKIRLRLEDDLGPSWLIHFVFGDDGVSVEEKKIPSLIGRIKYGRVDCKEQADSCREILVRKPSYVAFKVSHDNLLRHVILFGSQTLSFQQHVMANV